MSEPAPPKPSDAIAFLGQIVKNNPIKIDSRYLAEDLAYVRRAFPDDQAFAVAIFAIAKRLTIVCRQKNNLGSALHFELDGWHKESFPADSKPGSKADLRLVFRVKNDEVELLGFGHRHIPQSVYLTARKRRTSRSLRSR